MKKDCDPVKNKLDISGVLKFAIDKIRETRKQKGFSQFDLAIEADISQSFITCVENGKKKPSVETLLKIALALEASPRSFFPENEDIPWLRDGV